MQVDHIQNPRTRWHYFVPGDDHGWGAVVYIDSAGVFLAFSDWGTYGYRWTAPGCDDMRKFFTGDMKGRQDYFVTKFSGGERVFDAADTRKTIRARITELRREKHITAELARAEWELAGNFDNEAECLAYWFCKTKLEGEETHSLPVYRVRGQVVAFCEIILPKLAVLIEDEIAEGEAAVMIARSQAG